MKTLHSPSRKGNAQTVILPFCGETSIDENGNFEVDETVVDVPSLLAAGVGVVDPSVKVEKAAEEVKPKTDKEVAIENINAMKKPELIKLCEEAQLPVESYQDLKVGELKELLIARIS